MELADREGSYRVALGTWTDGSSGLDLFDAERRHRLSLAEEPDARAPTGLTVFGPAGHLRALLALGPVGDRDASLEFWDRDGAYRAGFGTWPDGGSGSQLVAAAGGLLGRVGQRPRVPATVELDDGRGGVRAAMGEYPDGAGAPALRRRRRPGVRPGLPAGRGPRAACRRATVRAVMSERSLRRLVTALRPARRRQEDDALAATRAVLDASLDAVVVIDREGTVVAWSRAAETTLLFSRDEAVGRRMRDLIVPPDLRDAHEHGMRRYLATGEAHLLGDRVEITAVRRDGCLIPVELTITRVDHAPDLLFAGFIRDISARKRAERAERVLAHVGDMFAASLSTRERAAWTAELVAAHMARAAVVALHDGDRVTHLERVEDAEVGEVLRAAAAQAAAERAPSRRDEDATAYIAVPLIAGRRTLGALAMAVDVASPPVHAGDLRLAEELARRCALAIDHARSYEQRTRETRVLQSSLIPAALPQPPDMVVAGTFHAAGDMSRFGGDFYDVFVLGRGRWAAVVGDVRGKGPRAAAITAQVRYSLRAVADGFDTPSAALERLNALLLAGPAEALCTAALAFLTPREDGVDVVLALAGHPAPLVRRHDGATSEIGHYGPLLGAFPGVVWRDARTRLGPGERLVVYTDGVVDQRRDGRVTSVAEELEAQVAALADQSAAHLAERIVAWAAGAQRGDPVDDAAVLVLESAPGTVVVQRSFPASASSIGGARRFVGAAIAGSGADPEAVTVMLSEVFTNAVRFSTAEGCDVLVERSPRGVRVEVRSDGGDFVAPDAMPDSGAVGGRGLMIVDALADAWGIDAGGGRTAVWFRVDAERGAPPGTGEAAA